MIDSSAISNLSEFVFTNIFGGTLLGLDRPESLPLTDTQSVETAVPFHPETITYWHLNGSVMEQMTHAEAFVESLWLHANFGSDVIGHDQAPLMAAAGLAVPLVTAAEVHDILGRAALRPTLDALGLTDAMVLSYAEAVAPDAIQLVGVPPAH